MREKKNQKGAGACSSKTSMTTTDVCPARIRELETIKLLIETLLRFAGDTLDDSVRQHYNQGIQMLSNQRLLEMIARSDQMYNMFLTKKQELTLMILSYWLNTLQDTNQNNSLFRSKIESTPENPIKRLYYELVNETNNDCGDCPITLEPINNGEGVKISHIISIDVPIKDENGNTISSTTKNETFSICLSKKIFDEPAIKDAMAANNIWMKHPLLRDQAWIDLPRVKIILNTNGTEGQSSPPPQASQASPETQTGGLKLKRTDKKITLHGRERTIYMGKHNKQFVQMNRQYVSVSSLSSTSYKKASKKRL